MTSAADPDTPYGLRRPTMGDARESVHRAHGSDGPRVWSRALTASGLGGHEDDDDSLERLLDALDGDDAVSRMCAVALRIRLRSHTFLAVAHDLSGSAA
jgi:hypothetical protein